MVSRVSRGTKVIAPEGTIIPGYISNEAYSVSWLYEIFGQNKLIVC